MRTNNSKLKNTIVSIYFILLMLAILGLVIFKVFGHLSKNPVVTASVFTVGFTLLFLVVYMNSKYFEYDSDGMKVVIINRGLLISDHLNYREKKLEFDKNELVAYKFQNYVIYKSLVLYIRSSHGSRSWKETFNVTLLTRKKRKYIRQSLSKMVKQNNKTIES